MRGVGVRRKTKAMLMFRHSVFAFREQLHYMAQTLLILLGGWVGERGQCGEKGEFAAATWRAWLRGE